MTPIHVNEYDGHEHSTVRTSIVTDTVSIMIRQVHTRCLRTHPPRVDGFTIRKMPIKLQYIFTHHHPFVPFRQYCVNDYPYKYTQHRHTLLFLRFTGTHQGNTRQPPTPPAGQGCLDQYTYTSYGLSMYIDTILHYGPWIPFVCRLSWVQVHTARGRVDQSSSILIVSSVYLSEPVAEGSGVLSFTAVRQSTCPFKTYTYIRTLYNIRIPQGSSSILNRPFLSSSDHRPHCFHTEHINHVVITISFLCSYTFPPPPPKHA